MLYKNTIPESLKKGHKDKINFSDINHYAITLTFRKNK